MRGGGLGSFQVEELLIDRRVPRVHDYTEDESQELPVERLSNSWQPRHATPRPCPT